MDTILPQGIYRVDHGQLPALELFLVALEPEAGTARYEAIFS